MVTECKEGLFSAMMRLKRSKQELFPSESLDQILQKPFQLDYHKKDVIKMVHDEKMVIDYYHQHPELFGFNSIEEYKSICTIQLDHRHAHSLFKFIISKGHKGDYQQLELPNGKRMNVDDACSYLDVELKKHEHLLKNIVPFRSCLGGQPLREHIAQIVRAQTRDDGTPLNQDLPEGDALAKRLRNLIKKKQECGDFGIAFMVFSNGNVNKSPPIFYD